MPIFPRYSPGAMPAAPSTPSLNVGAAGLPGQQLEQAGKQILGAGQFLKQVADKRKEFKDDTMVASRYLDAVSDLELIQSNMDQPDVALQGKQYWATEYAKKSPKWFEGLSPEAQRKLRDKIGAKTIEYQVYAGRRENKAWADYHEATLVREEEALTDKFARGVGPDDASALDEFKPYAKNVDRGVQLGYETMKEGEERKKKVITNAAYVRAHRLTSGDSEADLAQYLKLYAQEEKDPGSTFLRLVDADKRLSLRTAAYDRQTTLREKREKDMEKARKTEGNAFMNQVIRSFSTGDPADRMSTERIMRGLEEYEDVISREATVAIMKLVEQPRLEGGITNPEVLHRLRIGILAEDGSVRRPSDIVRHIGENLSAKDAEALLTQFNAQQSTEPGVEKNSFYKEGIKHLNALLLRGAPGLPGLQVLMRPQDAQRYSDGLLAFNKYARKLFQDPNADLSVLPAYARNLANSLLHGGAEGGGQQTQPTAPSAGTLPSATSSKKKRTGAKPSYARD